MWEYIHFYNGDKLAMSWGDVPIYLNLSICLNNLFKLFKVTECKEG